MADLTLKEDSLQYQDLARDFARNEIAPKAEHCDKSQQFPQDILSKAWDIGLLNVRLPESAGGLGLGLSDACVISEEIGAACTGIGAAFEATEVAQTALIALGSDDQQQKYLAPLAQMFRLAGHCLSQLFDNGVTYRHTGEGFELTGTDVIGANASSAAWFVVTATSSDTGSKSLFVMSKNSSMTVEKLATLGRRAADTGKMSFKNAPAELLGQEGAGDQMLERVLTFALPLVAAQAIGLSRSARENALRYSQERKTFGQPISNYQAINFMLADMAKDTESARLMCLKAAYLCDQGHPCAQQSMMAKTFAADAAMRIATDAVQIYGGYGYSREYPVEKLMRDSKMFQMYLGSALTSKVQIAKSLLASAVQ